MRDELRKYADEAYANVEYIANEIGPRVPGTEGEEKLHKYMSGKLKEIGLKPVTEKFLFAPFSAIGGLPYVGWGGIVIFAMLFVATMVGYFANETAGLVLHTFTCLYAVGLLVWLVACVFKYGTWLDWCFKQEVSHNTYAELLPEDGNYDYTIVLSGHTDTSWTLKHSAIKSKLNPAFIYAKLGLGAVGVITFIIEAFALLIALGVYVSAKADANWELWTSSAKAYSILTKIFWYSSPVLLVCSFLLTLYRERNPRAASPGAMDNATGVAISYEVVKYFKENPDKMPKNCRIIDLNVGAEEAGLRGAMSFVRDHKYDLANCYNINIDSIADKDFFEVIHGDTWLCPHFDKDLEKMFFDAMKEAGIEKPGNIANPVGGCDSTPFARAGVKTITFAAQNPIMSNYYHTVYDVPERFDADTVGLGLDVVLRVIDKIADRETAKAGENTNCNE